MEVKIVVLLKINATVKIPQINMVCPGLPFYTCIALRKPTCLHTKPLLKRVSREHSTGVSMDLQSYSNHYNAAALNLFSIYGGTVKTPKTH